MRDLEFSPLLLPAGQGSRGGGGRVHDRSYRPRESSWVYSSPSAHPSIAIALWASKGAGTEEIWDSWLYRGLCPVVNCTRACGKPLLVLVMLHKTPFSLWLFAEQWVVWEDKKTLCSCSEIQWARVNLWLFHSPLCTFFRNIYFKCSATTENCTDRKIILGFASCIVIKLLHCLHKLLPE